jgi:heptosyltransferase-3
MSVDFNLPERPRILVVTLRRLGDVLLTTPLIRTLRKGFPNAILDTLVFRGSDRILKGNPDLDHVLTMSERPSAKETLATIGRLWRRYDLVVSTQGGDRPTFFSLVAGRRRVGLVPHAGHGAWWKRRAYHRAVAAEPDCHRVEHLFGLADALGLARQLDIVCPQGSSANAVAPKGAYAVLHANPLYRYKRWNDTGWRQLARGLAERGLAVVATEGRDPAERAYVDSLWGETDSVIRERGQLDWSGLAALLKDASVYVGPDTSMTHLAAGSGCPTVALYGPTSPRLIGPWPVGGLAEPWAHAGTIQRRANVWVVQNPLPCLPCEKLGCEGHLDSRSQCLDELSANHVLVAVDQALAWSRERGSGWRGGRKTGMEGDMPLPSVKP